MGGLEDTQKKNSVTKLQLTPTWLLCHSGTAGLTLSQNDLGIHTLVTIFMAAEVVLEQTSPYLFLYQKEKKSYCSLFLYFYFHTYNLNAAFSSVLPTCCYAFTIHNLKCMFSSRL